MGQDNLGKIILALFSFKRLHDKYPRQYKGGILAIDEMDATMYPASQVELLKILRRYASKLNLQILFTANNLLKQTRGWITAESSTSLLRDGIRTRQIGRLTEHRRAVLYH